MIGVITQCIFYIVKNRVFFFLLGYWFSTCESGPFGGKVSRDPFMGVTQDHQKTQMIAL